MPNDAYGESKLYRRAVISSFDVTVEAQVQKNLFAIHKFSS